MRQVPVCILDLNWKWGTVINWMFKCRKVGSMKIWSQFEASLQCKAMLWGESKERGRHMDPNRKTAYFAYPNKRAGSWNLPHNHARILCRMAAFSWFTGLLVLSHSEIRCDPAKMLPPASIDRTLRGRSNPLLVWPNVQSNRAAPQVEAGSQHLKKDMCLVSHDMSSR